MLLPLFVPDVDESERIVNDTREEMGGIFLGG